MLSTALCNALKDAYPQAQVDMMTMSHCAGVVESNPNITEIIILDKKRRDSLRYVYEFLMSIRARKYDVIVNMQGQIVGLLTCLFSRSSRRIGENKFPWRYAHSDNMVLPGSAEPSGEGNAVDVRFAMIASLLPKPTNRIYKIWLSEAELQAAAQTLREAGVDSDKPLIAFAVNARDAYKQWPLEYFAQIACWLMDTYGLQIYVFFGPGEEEYSKRLKRLIPEDKRYLMFDDIRTRSIRELAAMFPHCALYVGNDTGPRHIAQAVGLPAFAIVSPASNKWGWAPWDNPRYRAVDSGDALGLSSDEWLAIRSKLRAGVNDADWFAKLDADFVQARVQEMIEELELFAESAD